MKHVFHILIAVALLGGCSSGSGGSSATNAGKTATAVTWTSHGATACAQFFTPAFVGQIFATSNGQNKSLSAQACAYSNNEDGINLVLIDDVGLNGFDSDPATQGGSPLSGIGDKAVRTTIGGIEAYKKGKGICGIDVSPPFGNKLSGDALAQKLGEVCNQAFALP